MNRQSNIPFSPSGMSPGAAAACKQQQPGRVPKDFREAMKHVSGKPADNANTGTSYMAAKTSPALKRTGQPSASKWRSSFIPVGEEEDNSEDKCISSPERVELYNPYDPASSDSENEMSQGQDHNHSPPDQDNNLARQRLSPGRGCHDERCWDSSYSEPESLPLERHDFDPETRPTESRGLSPCQRLPQAYSPDTETLVPPGYGSINRPLDHRVCSPDRLVHGSSTQRFLASYGAQRANGEERITIPECRRETTTGRLSPPRIQRDYQHQSGYMETGLDKVTPPTEVTRHRSKNIIMNKSPIICDLCNVELANGQELQDHLESRTHWDTLEHIQQENDYDDLAIAFLQEVMLYKSRQCSRPIEDSVLQALQENDHMTKIEMFLCAACNIFLSTSASSVQAHITSQEHLSNTKDFEVQQRRACLDKAKTLMMELQPQFEHFLKGGSPFE